MPPSDISRHSRPPNRHRRGLAVIFHGIAVIFTGENQHISWVHANMPVMPARMPAGISLDEAATPNRARKARVAGEPSQDVARLLVAGVVGHDELEVLAVLLEHGAHAAVEKATAVTGRHRDRKKTQRGRCVFSVPLLPCGQVEPGLKEAQ